MAYWACHQFYGQLDHFGSLWPLGHITFHWPLMASGHILQPLALLANPPPHQPPGQYLVFGPGRPSCLPRAYGPASNQRGLWPNHFDYGVKGLNGLFGPFRPELHNPQSMVYGICRPPLA
ncbi:hypothetical protein O181_060137 [Austropuccinia psidii MF-1]|uniref:Uncharacterized protein n=1 Tax=Austropuccinia psidii MF-1 TaxID=1389203 RepID=A0A9Q3HY41_9BASI|nr:hypothetical protein [Austropuccinia psidii MF-1]